MTLNSDGVKGLAGGLGLVVAAVITCVATLIVADRLPFPSFKTMPTPNPSPAPIISCIVPEVIGLDESSAIIAIVQSGLEPVKSVAYDTHTPSGIVAAQDPPANEVIRPCKGRMSMIVSLGPTPTPSPPTLTPAPASPTATVSAPVVFLLSNDTSPDTVLGPGEIWQQGGIQIRLRNPTRNSGCFLRFGFEITIINNTGQPQAVDLKGLDISVSDSFGKFYPEVYWKSGAAATSCYREQLDALNVSFMEGNERLDFAFQVVGISSSPATITVVVFKLGPISNAKWQVTYH
jgi:hypothetical protein